eukprot:TRINITY_DN31545_c0_g1_i2.p1 TRINITY_DN31545_c0_g1~~TRINITY_DN31545_c0_g1_i2.p1  ORF type:complete len:410 (-),score=58.00 TRINITY_DN31545_c0_g1_i2:214-1443(-)
MAGPPTQGRRPRQVLPQSHDELIALARRQQLQLAANSPAHPSDEVSTGCGSPLRPDGSSVANSPASSTAAAVSGRGDCRGIASPLGMELDSTDYLETSFATPYSMRESHTAAGSPPSAAFQTSHSFVGSVSFRLETERDQVEDHLGGCVRSLAFDDSVNTRARTTSPIRSLGSGYGNSQRLPRAYIPNLRRSLVVPLRTTSQWCSSPGSPGCSSGASQSPPPASALLTPSALPAEASCKTLSDARLSTNPKYPEYSSVAPGIWASLAARSATAPPPAQALAKWPNVKLELAMRDALRRIETTRSTVENTDKLLHEQLSARLSAHASVARRIAPLPSDSKCDRLKGSDDALHTPPINAAFAHALGPALVSASRSNRDASAALAEARQELEEKRRHLLAVEAKAHVEQAVP